MHFFVYFLAAQQESKALGGAQTAGFYFTDRDRGPETAGSRPRTPSYSFVTPQKSKQKKAPELLALRVPSTEE